MTRRYFFCFSVVSLIALSIAFTSCNELADCVASASPELQTKTFPVATVGTSYDQGVTAEIRNDANDNDYQYFFDITGQIPPGLSRYVNNRTLHFAGTPTQAGQFTFTVKVHVDPPAYYDGDGGLFEDDDRICFGNDTTEKTYTITVRP